MAIKTINQEERDFWAKYFNQEAIKMADKLLEMAKSKASTYGEALSYLKQVDQLAITINKPENRAARLILDNSYALAKLKLYDEQNELPIKSNSEPTTDGGDSK